MDKIRQIRYGGAVTGLEEERAIIRSIRKSRKTRNWQQAEEGALLEKELSQYLNVKYTCLTNSGSSAGLLALSALELPKGSEVIISAVTFPTIFNIILQCGLVPVVVDAKIGIYGFSIEDVEKAITKKTRAIIAIHPLGNPVDMPKLMKLVKKYKQKIYVLEDCCDSLSSTINEKQTGSFGDISFTSFHAAHIVSMGVGGGVFTSSKDIAQRVRMYRDWGRQADINKSENLKHKSLPKDYNPRFIYEKIGYNFQILELQAAMGRVQLRKTARIKAVRKRNFDYLYKVLSNYPFVLPETIKGSDVCWFSFPITYHGDRGPLLRHLEKNGIETRPMFSGNITRHPAYTKNMYRVSGSLKEADYITRHSFWVSLHPSLKKSDLSYMIKVFNEFFATHENTKNQSKWGSDCG
jgi:CDP-6-deoxy-D-xylo-4-hexulose-3-dehydrase